MQGYNKCRWMGRVIAIWLILYGCLIFPSFDNQPLFAWTITVKPAKREKNNRKHSKTLRTRPDQLDHRLQFLLLIDFQVLIEFLVFRNQKVCEWVSFEFSFFFCWCFDFVIFSVFEMRRQKWWLNENRKETDNGSERLSCAYDASCPSRIFKQLVRGWGTDKL